MLYSITRIPILVVLFTGLIVFLVSMQPSTVSTLTSEENATTTPLAQEIITTATTTATSTDDILSPTLATSTATSSVGTLVEESNPQQVEISVGNNVATPQETDPVFDEVSDCVAGAGREVFRNPGECLRMLRY